MNVKLCREWFEKAEEDYQGAMLLGRRRKSPLLNLICFHSQQACEKYLKAYLALNGIDFPKTHDLIPLKSLCAKKDSSFELVSDLITVLNPYSVEFRYPGEQAARGDAKRALSCAKEIRSFMLPKLKKMNNKSKRGQV